MIVPCRKEVKTHLLSKLSRPNAELPKIDINIGNTGTKTHTCSPSSRVRMLSYGRCCCPRPRVAGQGIPTKASRRATTSTCCRHSCSCFGRMTPRKGARGMWSSGRPAASRSPRAVSYFAYHGLHSASSAAGGPSSEPCFSSSPAQGRQGASVVGVETIHKSSE
jgi:hypothetical protein